MNKAHITISKYAVNQYCERVDKTLHIGKGRVALFRVWRIAEQATEYQLKHLRAEEDGEVTFMVAETCYGLIVMPVRNGVMTTLWLFER